MASKRKIWAVLIAVLLVACMAFALVGCKPKEQPLPPEPPVDHTAEYREELITAFKNVLMKDWEDGANVDIDGSISYRGGDGAWKYSYDIMGNLLVPEDENGKANNDFSIVIKDETKLVPEEIFALYSVTDKESGFSNLLVKVGDDKVNLEKTDFFGALRAIIDSNVDGGLKGSLGGIEINGEPLHGFLDVLGLAGGALLEPGEVISKDGNSYTFTVKVTKAILDLVSGVLPDAIPQNIIDFLSTLALPITITTAGTGDAQIIKNIEVGVNVYGEDDKGESEIQTDIGFTLNSANDGLVGAANAALDIESTYAEGVKELKAVPSAKFLQARFAGTFNLMSKDADGSDKVFKSLDWKFVSNLDLIHLMDKNFMLSDPDFKDNFFHLQISHTCQWNTCSKWCQDNMVGKMFDDTNNAVNIIDISFAPGQLGTDNLLLDLDIGGLLTGDALDAVLALALNDPSVDAMGSIVEMLTGGRLVMSLDTDAITKSDNTADASLANLQSAPALGNTGDGGGSSLDIMSLLTGIIGVFTTMDTEAGVTLDLDTIDNLVADLAGDSFKGLVKTILSVGVVKDNEGEVIGVTDEVTGLNISGVYGVGSYVLAEFATPNVLEYDVKKHAVDQFVDGRDRLGNTSGNNLNAYSGYDLFSGGKVGGDPALYTTDVEMSGDKVVLYDKDENVVEGAISAYDWKYKYKNGSEFFVKYTYVGYDGETHTDYTAAVGWQGLDLKKAGAQKVTILLGQTGGGTLISNLKAGLAMLGNLIPADLNLDTIIPLPSAAFEVSVEVTPLKSDKLTVETTNNLKAGEKSVYNVGEAIDFGSTFVIKEDGVVIDTISHTSSNNNLTSDVFGNYVPGEYTVRYALDRTEVGVGTTKITIDGVETTVPTNYYDKTVVINDYDTVEFKINYAVDETGKSLGYIAAELSSRVSRTVLGEIVYKKGDVVVYSKNVTFADVYSANAFLNINEMSDVYWDWAAGNDFKYTNWGMDGISDFVIEFKEETNGAVKAKLAERNYTLAIKVA